MKIEKKMKQTRQKTLMKSIEKNRELKVRNLIAEINLCYCENCDQMFPLNQLKILKLSKKVDITKWRNNYLLCLSCYKIVDKRHSRKINVDNFKKKNGKK